MIRSGAGEGQEELRAEILNAIGHPQIKSGDVLDRVTIHFMINAKNEVVILSTSNDDYDHYIKSKLNYYELTNSRGVINKQYTFPLVIQNP